jgi:uncharacterized damage-inducible protein DinB
MKAKLLTTIDNSRNYTLEVAGTMPEKNYDTKLVPDGWSFKELMSHIAYGIDWWKNNYIDQEKIDWAPPEAEKNKQDVVKYLNKAYDSLQASIRKKEMNEDVLYGFYATLDHITHHRGQAVIFLRKNGITPPEYTY